VWNVLKALWNDSVWSKVIAWAITILIGGMGAAIRFHWWNRISAVWAIKLTMTNGNIICEPWRKGYPLRHYVEMRNDSSKCIEVSVFKYIPNTITVKSFPPEVMQVRFHTEWFPPEYAERVAVLPGQLCRAWIGIDDRKFNEGQVTAVVGSIGTLVVSANKKHVSFVL
jgi:hypothetical protein